MNTEILEQLDKAIKNGDVIKILYRNSRGEEKTHTLHAVEYGNGPIIKAEIIFDYNCYQSKELYFNKYNILKIEPVWINVYDENTIVTKTGLYFISYNVYCEGVCGLCVNLKHMIAGEKFKSEWPYETMAYHLIEENMDYMKVYDALNKKFNEEAIVWYEHFSDSVSAVYWKIKKLSEKYGKQYEESRLEMIDIKDIIELLTGDRYYVKELCESLCLEQIDEYGWLDAKIHWWIEDELKLKSKSQPIQVQE